jgi:hypothetical protein
MKKVLILLKRKSGTTFAEFQEHYENSHAKLGEKYFGHLFQWYCRNYIPVGRTLAEDGSSAENAYDCITEIVFRTEEDYAEFHRIANDPEVRQVLIDDEELFLDRGASANAPCDPIETDLSVHHGEVEHTHPHVRGATSSRTETTY